MARLTGGTDAVMWAASLDQLLTEIRSTSRFSHREPDIHAVPSSMRLPVTSRVRSSDPKFRHTCVKTTWVRTNTPGRAVSSGERRVRAHSRRSRR